MTGIVYRIFNLKNNKSYIGKTYVDFYTRLRQHINDAKRYPTRPLYKAFKKYGINNFSAEILGHYDNPEEWEILFIEQYGSFGYSGYNATMGGDGTRYVILPEDCIVEKYLNGASMRELTREYNVDVYSIKRVLSSNNITINSQPIIGNKRVLIVELNEEFDSIKECARLLIDAQITEAEVRGVASKISQVCKGARGSYLGFTYKFI